MNNLKPNHHDTKTFDRKVSTGHWEYETELDGIIKASERKLLNTLFFVFGGLWALLFFFELETRWYGIGLLVMWIASAGAIVIRVIGELRRKEL